VTGEEREGEGEGGVQARGRRTLYNTLEGTAAKNCTEKEGVGWERHVRQARKTVKRRN
jgi:hypothetical protein